MGACLHAPVDQSWSVPRPSRRFPSLTRIAVRSEALSAPRGYAAAGPQGGV